MGFEGPAEPGVSREDARGKVLFEDNWTYRHLKSERTNVGVVLILIGITFPILLGVSFVGSSHAVDGPVIAGIFGAGFVLVGAAIYLLGVKYLVNFRLYENGIRFTTRKFVDFGDIYYIEREGGLLDMVRIYTNYQQLVPYYDIADAGNMSPLRMMGTRRNLEWVSDWGFIYQNLVRQLKLKHPGVNEHWLIRDFVNVTWSHEARMLFEARKGPPTLVTVGGSPERKILEAVLLSGRNQVEVGDVWWFLSRPPY